ncbi:MAG: hypothetical protein Q4P71_01990 [Actinomycetaceae bacterium]|nr:hypothetical protein [Actinomycetaceae bacterium]
MRFSTSDGKYISIHPESGASGGEGTVFDIQGNPNLVAKIIHADRLSQARQHKIEAMIKDKPHLDLITFDDRIRRDVPTVAWPVSGLYQNGNFRGFIMNAVNRKETLSLAEACNPVVRRDIKWQEWDPQRDLVFATAIARNLALAVGQAHKANIVIGDLSSNNVLVSRSLIVTLIDCDSMQFIDRSGHLHYCTGMTRSFLAPEVPAPSPTTGPIELEPQSDLFALAVHIYYLLIGRHPFANGAFSDSYAQPDPDLLAKQGEWRGKEGGLLRVEPGTLDPQTFLPTYMVDMFVRAFEDGIADPMKRPTANQWQSALEDFAGGSSHRRMRGIQICANAPSHSFPGFLSRCPMCGKNSKSSASPPIKNKSQHPVSTAHQSRKLKRISPKELLKSTLSAKKSNRPPTVEPARRSPRENLPPSTRRPAQPSRQSPADRYAKELLHNISMRTLSGVLTAFVVYFLALGTHSLLFGNFASEHEGLVPPSVAFANSSAATALICGVLMAVFGSNYYFGWALPFCAIPVASFAPARNNFIWPSSAEWISPYTQSLSSYMWLETKTAAIIVLICALFIWGIALYLHPTTKRSDSLNRVIQRLLGEPSTYDYSIIAIGSIAFLLSFLIDVRVRFSVLTQLLEGRLLRKHADVFDVSAREPHVYLVVAMSAILCVILLFISIALVINLEWKQRMISVISAVLIYAVVLFIGIPTTQELWNIAEEKTAHSLRRTPARVKQDTTVCVSKTQVLKAEDGDSWLWQAYATTSTDSSTCDVLTIYRGHQHVKNLTYKKTIERGITLTSVEFTGKTENDGVLTVTWSSGGSIEVPLADLQASD